MTSVLHPATSRRIRSLRTRGGRSGSGRLDHAEDSLPLDLSQDPNDTVKEILRNISGQQIVSTSRKLGHLNNFVKLLCSIPEPSMIDIPMEVIMTCLKGTLVSDVNEVRAAGVRVLRYLINDEQTKQIFIDLHLDYLVTKCLDISHFNEVERIQAIRLIRKIAHLKQKHPNKINPIVPLPLMACVVSISMDGAEERDRVYRTCLAVLCELALLQPWLVIRCNGVLALINAILECHMYQRINECLCLSLMHIIDHPSLSKWHHTSLDVSPTFAPYTELNYRLHPDVEESKLKGELDMRFSASKMAIVSLLRTWLGLLHICNSKYMIQSFVQALLIPNEDVRRGILSVLCDLFYFNELGWTGDFQKELAAAAPGHFKDSWRISEGFVVAEGKSLLPLRHVSRPDLVDCHLAIMLSSFLRAGLLEALTKVAISKESDSSVGATIVLGLTLHLASRLLPSDDAASSWQWHLPHLLKNDSSQTSVSESLRINVTVKRLQEINLMKNSTPKPCSLYLDELVSESAQRNITSESTSYGNRRSRTRSSTINVLEPTSTSQGFSILKRNRSLNIIRDFSDDHYTTALKNTKVLTTKEYKEWNWEALQCLFLSSSLNPFLRAVGVDEMLRRFYRRLIYFYQPSTRLFSALDLAKDGKADENRKFVQTAIYIFRVLSSSDDEGQRLLTNLINDIVQSLPKVGADAATYSKASGSLAVTCSREYFLILGTLSSHPKGDRILGLCKAYNYFMELASSDTHEILVRLLVSSLHYSEDRPARMVLSKALTTCGEPSRLYATGFLRVLLRSNCPGFQRWGTELLTTQLFDNSNEVASEALDILHEACDDRDYLRAVVRLRPTLLHLGDRGAILVCRFMSEPKGFTYLSRNNYLDRELKRWWNEYNERYVLHVEELLKLSLTTYERPNKEDGFVRRSGNRKTRQSVFLPAHLYGELCRHEAGARLIQEQNITPLLTASLRDLVSLDEKEKQSLKKENFKEESGPSRVLKMKSFLWALAHIGSTVYGLPLLGQCDTLPLITQLASGSSQSSIRGTCVYCLCAIAQTIPGVEALKKLGYQCVLNMVNKDETVHDASNLTLSQPIVTPRMVRGSYLNKSISSSSRWSTGSTSSSTQNKSPPGSVGNISSLSEIGSKSGRSSRSWAFGKTSSKSKNRSEGKNISPDDNMSVCSHVSSELLSASNVSRHSSVLDVDSGSFSSSNYQEAKSPSPLKTLSERDGQTRTLNNKELVNRKSSLPVISSVGVRSQTITVGVHPGFNSSKPKFRTRLMDLFLRKGRSKSAMSSAYHEQNYPGDDFATSGYAFDNHPSIEMVEQNSPSVPDPTPTTQTDGVQKKLSRNSAAFTSSSTNSVDTLKTGDISVESCKEANSDLEDSNKDATLKGNVSVWNTNNSGQSSSQLSSTSLDRQRYKTTDSQPLFYATIRDGEEEEITPSVDGSRPYNSPGKTKRTRSLPDVLESKKSPKTSPFHTLPTYKRHRPHYVSASQSTDELMVTGTNNLGRDTSPTTRTLKSALPASQPSPGKSFDDDPLLDSSVTESPTVALAGDSVKTSIIITCEPGVDGETETEPRRRGNTQVSQDSGMGADESPDLCVSNYVKDNDVTLAQLDELPEVLGENQWRRIQPKGLTALRLIRQQQLKRPRSPLQSDVLSSEERDYILKNTRYVGVAIPYRLSDLFKPVPKEPSSKARFDLQREKNERVEYLEAVEIVRERKVSTRQAPKFRGLDESTFGTAVTEGIVHPKLGKMHPILITPCGRTPDSILSEASDFCYIGGQLVEQGSDEYVTLLHDEIILLVSNLASSVGIKQHETSLLMMKEKRPEIFDSITLYNNIVEMMSEYSYRLTTRRFVQELFQDIKFTEVHVDARRALQSIT